MFATMSPLLQGLNIRKEAKTFPFSRADAHRFKGSDPLNLHPNVLLASLIDKRGEFSRLSNDGRRC